VEDDTRQPEAAGPTQLVGEDVDGALPQRALRTREVEEIGRVGEAPSEQVGRGGRGVESADLVLGQRRRGPPSRGTEEELQRLASDPSRGERRARDAARGGEVRTEEGHGSVCYAPGAMRASWILRWSAAGAGVMIGCGIAVWAVLWISLRSSAATVPDVRGMETAHAAAVVQSRGLVVRIQDGVFDPQLAPGRVAVERPPAGFQAKRGATVLLYPSLGREVQKLGDLTGLPVSVAETELDNEHLSVGRRCEVEGEADAAVVLAQMPAPATLVAPGSTVTLLINRTPRQQRYVMPNFVGQSAPEAERVLRELGFQLAEVQPVVYPGVPLGTVLRQDPPAGGPVVRAAVVGLWVSQ
jgi:beta-lactam-binding protein with PASTA domain